LYIFIFSLAEFVNFRGGQFNSKTLKMVEGTPLPASFVYGGGLFNFVVNKDLSVTFNGTR
jgi:hypothetical protein